MTEQKAPQALPAPGDMEALGKLAKALEQVARAGLRGFLQPFIMRAVYVEARRCVAIPIEDWIAAVEAVYPTLLAALAAKTARIAEAEKVVEPFAEIANCEAFEPFVHAGRERLVVTNAEGKRLWLLPAEHLRKAASWLAEGEGAG